MSTKNRTIQDPDGGQVIVAILVPNSVLSSAFSTEQPISVQRHPGLCVVSRRSLISM